MITEWFCEDIKQALSRSRRCVVADPKGEGRFLIESLDDSIRIIEAGDAWQELAARYEAEKNFADQDVVFCTKSPLSELTLLQEYASTSPSFDFSALGKYIREKLWAKLKVNAKADDKTLCLAARLSSGRDENWWQGVAQGIVDPMDMKAMIAEFLASPHGTIKKMDVSVRDVFTKDLYQLIGRQYSGQTVPVMAQETSAAIFQSLIDNNISDDLLEVYHAWIDSVSAQPSVDSAIGRFELPGNANPVKAHRDHPFEELDRKLTRMLAKAVEDNSDTSAILHALAERLASAHAGVRRGRWLESLLRLFSFKHQGIYKSMTLEAFCKCYQQEAAALDNAMRHIYVDWLNEPEVLKPLQHVYEQLNRETLMRWHEVMKSYVPTQHGILAQALNQPGRIAVIVGDGLRLEIAEEAAAMVDCAEIERGTRLSLLPSVTECGMSALYGCDGVEANAQKRIAALKSQVADVEVKPLDMLNDSETAQKLVLTYGDIDQAGEKKQLAGLKDISGYPIELAEAVKKLLGLGFNRVYMTADHGFVITGLLSEADKIPVPSGGAFKVEERYLLSNDDNPMWTELLQSSEEYAGYKFQYYSRSDKPFVSKGAYGYAHGGFTPQECIIPLYCFKSDQSDVGCRVMIANKNELDGVIGNYFKVKIKAEADGSGIFGASRKIKMQVCDSAGKAINVEILDVKAGEVVTREWPMAASPLKFVVSDAETTQQLDSCTVSQSSARDLGGLL